MAYFELLTQKIIHSLKNSSKLAYISILSSAILLSACGNVSLFNSKASNTQTTVNTVNSPTQNSVNTAFSKIDAKPASVLWKQAINSSKQNFHENQISLVGQDLIIASNKRLWRINALTGKQVYNQYMKEGIYAGAAANQTYTIWVDQQFKLQVHNTQTGEKLFDIDLGQTVKGLPLLIDNLVIIRTVANHLIAYDLQQKMVKWKHERKKQDLILATRTNPTLYVDGMLVSGFHDAKLAQIAINTGSTNWEQPVSYTKGHTITERLSDIVSPPIYKAELDLIITASYQGKLAAYGNKQGDLKWNVPFSTTKRLASNANSVFASHENGYVHSYSLEGKLQWKQLLKKDSEAKDLLTVENSLYVVDEDGYLYALNAKDGSLKHRIKLGGKLAAPLVKIGQQLLIYLSNGEVQAHPLY